MSKMTDEQIKKALEMCHLQGITSECKGCFYRECPDSCIEDMQKDALELINRQQAENSRQKAEIEKLQLSRKQKLKEIEKLTINMNAFGLGMKREKERADQIKTEAIKEFAERLKEVTEEYGCYIPRTIDSVAKEMVGEQE